MKRTNKNTAAGWPAASPEGLVAEVLKKLQSQGFKRTQTLVRLLGIMASDQRPRTLVELAANPGLERRNPATLYRLMLKLERADIVRRVNLRERAQSFQLLAPGSTPDYLVCTQCGDLKQVETPPEIDSLKALVTQKTGWKQLRHELEFFGICPRCTQ